MYDDLVKVFIFKLQLLDCYVIKFFDGEIINMEDFYSYLLLFDEIFDFFGFVIVFDVMIIIFEIVGDGERFFEVF